MINIWAYTSTAIVTNSSCQPQSTIYQYDSTCNKQEKNTCTGTVQRSTHIVDGYELGQSLPEEHGVEDEG